MDKIGVVADYFNFIIPGIYDGFEDLHFEVGDLDPFQSSDQFFCFPLNMPQITSIQPLRSPVRLGSINIQSFFKNVFVTLSRGRAKMKD